MRRSCHTGSVHALTCYHGRPNKNGHSTPLTRSLLAASVQESLKFDLVKPAETLAVLKKRIEDLKTKGKMMAKGKEGKRQIKKSRNRKKEKKSEK